MAISFWSSLQREGCFLQALRRATAPWFLHTRHGTSDAAFITLFQTVTPLRFRAEPIICLLGSHGRDACIRLDIHIAVDDNCGQFYRHKRASDPKPVDQAKAEFEIQVTPVVVSSTMAGSAPPLVMNLISNGPSGAMPHNCKTMKRPGQPTVT